MSRYRSRKVEEPDGPVIAYGLPPSEKAQVLVIGQNGKKKGFAEEIRSSMEEVSATHPLAKTGEEEILVNLQETREIAAAERHERGEGFAEEIRSLMEEVRATHPLAKLSEEEIIARLRETREIVAAQRQARRTVSQRSSG